MNFELTEEQNLIRDMVREFRRNRSRPVRRRSAMRKNVLTGR